MRNWVLNAYKRGILTNSLNNVFFSQKRKTTHRYELHWLFKCMSVCTLITCAINTSPHFAFEYGLSCNQWWRVFHMLDFFFFWRGQTVFICVSTGPLALPKIDFSVCTHSFQPESTYFFSWSSVCLSVRHYYSGKLTCTMSTSCHFGFEYALVMQLYGFSSECTLICIF